MFIIRNQSSNMVVLIARQSSKQFPQRLFFIVV
jgi:hypothetical protein